MARPTDGAPDPVGTQSCDLHAQATRSPVCLALRSVALGQRQGQAHSQAQESALIPVLILQELAFGRGVSTSLTRLDYLKLYIGLAINRGD